MEVDKGIFAMLPPAIESKPAPIKERNVLKVFLNAENKLMVEKEWIEMEELKELVYTHITNNGILDNYAESSTKAVISLKNNRQTTYNNYLSVYNEIRAAYNQARNQMAFNNYGKNFETLSKTQKQIIQKAYPIKISEAEYDLKQGI